MLDFIRFLDSTFLGWMIELRNEFFVSFFSVITLFGKWYIILFIALIISYFLFRFSKKQYIIPLFFTIFFTAGTVGFLKIFFQRARPLDSLYQELLPSFPSWHSAGSLAFYGFIIFLLNKELSPGRLKNILIILNIVWIILIGFSRLYLRVHYVSDVLVGYLTGAFCLLVGLFFLKKIKRV